jgi:flagellar hook-associated protein 2
MSSSGINFSGLSSGIDTESIITKLLAIERKPAQQLQTQQKALLDKDTAYKTVSAQLIAFQASATSLNRLRAFDVVTAESDNKDNVTVSANPGAQVGNHDIVVNSLATSHKVGSTEFSSQSDPIGVSGQIVLNGKAIQIRDTDTLQNIASNINAAGAGVNASIISPNANKFILTLGSTTSGAGGRISISDVGTGTLASTTLGLFDGGGGNTLKNAISTTGAASNNFKDSGTSIGTLLGITSPSAGTVQIAGTNVAIDLATDSLSGIASKINSAGISGVSAQIKNVTDATTNITTQRLEISGTQTFTDDKNILTNLGVLQRSFGSGKELAVGSDASFTIDGLSSTRASNTLTDVIGGVTINLLKDGGAKSKISISSDTEGIKTQINSFVSSYNKLRETIDGYSDYDPQTGKTGILFGDATTQNLVDTIVSGLTSDVNGLSGSYNQIAQLGITLDQAGKLSVSDDTLSKALANSVKDVGRVFRADGVATNPLIRFVSATGDTKASGKNGYAINITQVAEQAKTTAGTAQTQTLAQDETLTFGGALFGAGTTAPFSNGKTLSLKAGSSLSDVVSAVNGDSVISRFVTATISGGKLQLNSRLYGSTAEFSVISSVADSGTGNTTGIGSTATVVKGKDVQGTINGESATGTGQFLLGSQTGGSAKGLQIQVTTTTTGSAGNITFTSGVAHFTQYGAERYTNATDGVLTQESKTVQDGIDDIQQQGKDLDARLKEREDILRLRFAQMESAITKIRASSSGIAQLASLPNYNSK